MFYNIAGNKTRIIKEMEKVFSRLEFHTALDGFSGSSSVALLLKKMGKQVVANDLMECRYHIARAYIENTGYRLSDSDIADLCRPVWIKNGTISKRYAHRFQSYETTRNLDGMIHNISKLDNDYKKSMAISAICSLLCATLNLQRGGVKMWYLCSHRRSINTSEFKKHLDRCNKVYPSNWPCKASRQDIFKIDPRPFDLVYLDPPYAADSGGLDYFKAYQLIETITMACFGEENRKVAQDRLNPGRKKQFVADLDEMIWRFRKSTIVFSYSSTAFPREKQIGQLFKNNGMRIVEKVHVPVKFINVGSSKRDQTNEILWVAN